MLRDVLKMLLRSIGESKGRFFAILAIVTLGVGFFAGLKCTTPFMQSTGRDYLDASNMYDYQLLSTLGFTEEDVSAFDSLYENGSAEGGYSLDALAQAEGMDEAAYTFMDMPESIAMPDLVTGRYPEAENECVVDSKAFDEDVIGKTLTITSDNDTDTLDELKVKELTIVGLVQSPRYIGNQRGTTSIGSGSLAGFIYIEESAFDLEAYTEIILKTGTEEAFFSTGYEDDMSGRETEIKQFLKERGQLRYTTLKTDAEDKLAKAQKKVDDGKADLEKAKKKLNKAKKKLSKAKKKLADGKKTLADSREQLDEAYSQLTTAKTKLDKAKKQLSASKLKLDKAESRLKASKKKLDQAKKKLDASRTKLDTAKTKLAAAKNTLDQSRKQLDAGWEKYDQAIASGIPAEYLTEQKAKLDASETEYKKGLSQYKASYKEYQSGEKQYAKGLKKYQSGLSRYEKGKTSYESGLAQYKAGKAEYESGKTEYESGYRSYISGKAEYEQGVKDYKKGVKSYKKGLKSYKKGLAKYKKGVKKLKKGEKKLKDARKEVSRLKEPTTYALGLDSNTCYASFDNDVKIVDGIVNVFPIFFVLIAALVCITTMTRMVFEERMQIGTMKAMGYPDFFISLKYILYALSACTIGCILGFAGGTVGIPKVLWLAYGINYDFAEMKYHMQWGLLAGCLCICALGAIAATLSACKSELTEKPAELVRAKVPPTGKRILLEYIGPLWKRLSFLNKVTLRNTFRYKKRMLMMLLGIGGCTALVVTGFGVEDSIVNIMKYQYEDIQIFDLYANIEEADVEEAAMTALLDTRTADHTYGWQKELDLNSDSGMKAANVVFMEQETADRYISLHNSKETFAYPGKNEIVLTKKLAKKLKAGVGSKITLTVEDTLIEATVTGISDNYLGHYAYLSYDTLPDLGHNIIYANMAPDTETEDTQTLAAKLRGMDGVSYVSVSAVEEADGQRSTSSITYIVFLIVLFAGALAFVVLYNLTNINIMERIREVATIRVLGFYENETASYVLRENLILTLLGAVAGLFMGKALHWYILTRITVDRMTFDIRIAVISYVYSFALTILFTVIANQLMKGKIHKVNMAESLKSVE